MIFAAKLLALRITGPLTPKWVNSISPNSFQMTFFPSYTVTSTFFSDSPWSFFTSSSAQVKGTRAGESSVTVWLAASANR